MYYSSSNKYVNTVLIYFLIHCTEITSNICIYIQLFIYRKKYSSDKKKIHISLCFSFITIFSLEAPFKDNPDVLIDSLPHFDRVWFIRKSSKDDRVAEIFNWVASYSSMSDCRELVVFLRPSVKADFKNLIWYTK